MGVIEERAKKAVEIYHLEGLEAYSAYLLSGAGFYSYPWQRRMFYAHIIKELRR